MSRLKTTGEPPSPVELLRHVDVTAKATLRLAQVQVQPIISAQVPKGRTGRLAAATTAKVRQTKTGQALTIGPPRNAPHSQGATVAQVARWVQRGTGELRQGGGPKKPIRAKRRFGSMVLPGGARVRSVRGQAPNPYLKRIETIADPLVRQAIREGARKAARP